MPLRLETRTCAEQKSAVRTGEFDSPSAYERQGQYQQAEEDFWRASGAATAKPVAIMAWHDWLRVW